MTFVVALIYAGTVLLCLGTTAWIVRAWTQNAIGTKPRATCINYIAVAAALLVSAGIGIAEIISGRGRIRHLSILDGCSGPFFH
jgi:hypothetical protein